MQWEVTIATCICLELNFWENPDNKGFQVNCGHCLPHPPSATLEIWHKG